MNLREIMGHTAGLFGQWADVLAFQPTINELLIHEALLYQQRQCVALKEMLKQRDLMIQAHVKAVKLQVCDCQCRCCV